MASLKHSLLGISLLFPLIITACSGIPTTDSSLNKSATTTNIADNNALTYVRSIEGIDEFTLANGLKVLLFQDAAQPKTLVNITYRVGSVHENYGETGMAHLLEHMLFKGSTNFPNINDEFKKRGMATNASTWLDRTNYFEVFDASEESLQWALAMEADRMVNATFNEQQLKSEMTVVRNEMEKNENNPARMLMSRMSSMAFLWHNYGNSTIGARSDVENFPFAKLRNFYHQHYRPDNGVLTIAGRFDIEKTKKVIEETFGKIKKPATPIEELYTTEPTQDGDRIVNLRRVGDIPYIGLTYHLPSALHPDAAAMEVLQVILADYTRGRIQKQLVEKQIATSAAAFSFMLKDSSQFIFLAQGEKDKDTKTLETALINIAENIKNTPITDEELALAKANLAKQAEQAMRNVTGIGMALSEYIAKGDYRYSFYFRDLIAEVTKEQVQAAAEKYLIQSNRTLGRFIPTTSPVRAELPSPPDLNTLLIDYKGKAVIAAGEVFDNNVTNIKSRLVNTSWPEGTKISIYPKKLRGNEVLINMNFPTGNEKSLYQQGVAFDYLGSLITLGNKKYSKEAIANKLDQLKSSIMFNSTAGAFNINIKTDEQHLNETISFIGELLTDATFPQSELDIFKRSDIAEINEQRNDPGAVALDSFRSALYDYPKGHAKAYLSPDEKIAEINKLTSAKLNALYQQHMTITFGHIAVIGNVDAQAVSSKLHSSLAKLVTKIPYEKLTTQLKNLQGLVVTTETPDKANAQLYIVNPIKINTSHPDYLALTIANSIFGGDPFSSRIGARIRVKEGYSYSVGSGLNIPETPEQGLYYAYAIAAPENIDKVISAYQEEVERVRAQGFTAEELTQAVQGYINNRKRNWASEQTINNILITSSKYQRDLSFYEDQIAAVNTLTLTDVQNAFIKYIASQKVNVFKAGDFAKIEIN